MTGWAYVYMQVCSISLSELENRIQPWEREEMMRLKQIHRDLEDYKARMAKIIKVCEYGKGDAGDSL